MPDMTVEEELSATCEQRDALDIECARLEKEVEALRKDALRLDWLDDNGFSAYRAIDPIDGLSGHCVVVHETMKPRRGNVADTIREAIDSAMRK